MKKQIKGLRQYDMFGHLITMNFNKRGNRHKTLIGAVFSILIKILIYSYVALTFKSMFYLDANRNSITMSSEIIDDIGLVNYNQTGLFIFYVLRHQMNGDPIFI
jgi:hypothetical protein